MIYSIKRFLQPVLPSFVLALLGLAAGIIAIGYDVGSFTRMGPGFFPMALAVVLVLLSVFNMFREKSEDNTLASPAWRPFMAVTAGILAWVLLVEVLGFFIASACQIILCALALEDPRWKSILIMACVLSLGGYFLFVVQLGVPLPEFIG